MVYLTPRRKGPARKSRAAKCAQPLAEPKHKPRYGPKRVHFLVPKGERQMGPKSRWRAWGKAERTKAVCELIAAVSKNHKRLKRPPTGQEWAELVRIKCAKVISERAARRLFAPKKDIVAAMRQSLANRVSRRSAVYLRWCEENGVDPQVFAGVKGKNFWWT